MEHSWPRTDGAARKQQLVWLGVLAVVGAVLGAFEADANSAGLLLLVVPMLVVLPVVVGAVTGRSRTMLAPLLVVIAGITAGYLCAFGLAIPSYFNDAHDSCGGASDSEQRSALWLAAGLFVSAATYPAFVAYRAAKAFVSTRRDTALIALGPCVLGIAIVCAAGAAIAGGATSC